MVVPLKGSKTVLRTSSPSIRGFPQKRLVHQPAALSRFLEDVSAHSTLPSSPDQAQQRREAYYSDIGPDGATRRSDASEYGSTRQSIISLPSGLINGVQEVIQSVSHRSTIRTSALGLYGKYRMTSSKESLTKSNNDLMDSFLTNNPVENCSKKLVKPKLRTTYDHLTSISFAAGAMPSAYGATLRVLLEVKRRLNSEQIRRGQGAEWSPKSLIDYGSGTGSAAWAALEVWPDTLREYTGLDKSSSMLWLNENLLQKRSDSASQLFESNLASPPLKTSFKRVTISPIHADKEKGAEVLPKDLIDVIENEDSASTNLEPELKLSDHDWACNSEDLLAVMSFTLTDLPNQAARRQAVEGMWSSGAETIVIIDRGTPAGFQVVADARQQLLMLGRREIRKSSPHPVESDIATSKVVEDESSDTSPKNSKLGSWVLAPCPHDKACPLHLSENPRHFCHFSQRIERPKFLKDTKHTSKHEEDAKYSYVVIRRGQRAPSPLTFENSHFEGESDDQNRQQSFRSAALEWPRIILPPHKCKGHVIFDVCDASGDIKRMTIPRSQGKQDYYDARKSFWGDSWPHGSKKPGLVKSLEGRNGNRGDRRRKKKELHLA